MTPVLGALIGIVTTLIIVAVAIVFIVKTRGRDDASGSQISSKNASQTAVNQDTINHRETNNVMTLEAENVDEHNPDVVPNKNGTLIIQVG